MPLVLHFLNVGHGDCTLIEHPSGRITMIDVNNSKSLPEGDEVALAVEKGLTLDQFRGVGIVMKAGHQSWEDYYRSLLVDPVDYFSANFPGRSVFRYFQTHPDMDHMSGLYRMFWQEQIHLENMWDTLHEKTFDEAKFDKSRYEWADWLMYEYLRSGKRHDGSSIKVLHNEQGDTGDYWTPDNITVLAPTADLREYANSSENWNNISYVLKVVHAGRSVILPGDAEKPVWDKLESVYGSELKCDVLKAAHHGRESGYSESATEQMKPDAVICSVGKKPETDASDEYKGHGASVHSTRYNGTITATIDDYGNITIRNAKGEALQEL